MRFVRSVFLDRVASVEYTSVSLYGRRAVWAAFAACSAVPKANYNIFAQIGSVRTPPEEKDRCRNARFSPTYVAVIRNMDSASA